MSTNYYLRRKPTIEQVENLKKQIDETLNGTNFGTVLELVHQMYDSIDKYDREGGVIHLGKRSCGWKFLWCTNVYKKNTGYWDEDRQHWIDNYEIVKTYDLTREGLTEFIMRDEFVLVDEFGDVQDKCEFLDMAFNWDVDGWDSLSYRRDHPDGYNWNESEHQRIFAELGYMFENKSQSDFYSDGLRFSILDDFS